MTVNYPLALKYAQSLYEKYKNGWLKTYSNIEEMPLWYTEAEKNNMRHGIKLAIENLEEIITFYKAII